MHQLRKSLRPQKHWKAVISYSF